MIDSERLRRVRRWPVGDAAGGVSPDGRLFALGSSRGDGPRARPALGIGPALHRREGRGRLAARVHARSADTCDLARGRAVARLGRRARPTPRAAARARPRDVWGLQIAADGRTLYSAGNDERALVWDLAGDRRLIRPFDAGPPFFAGDRSPRGIAVSPDGRTVAVTQTDGSVDLVDSQTTRPRRSVRALDGFAAAVAFSPDGQLLAVSGEGGQVTLWDARTLRPAGELRGLSMTSQALAFSPDGSLLAAAELEDRDRISTTAPSACGTCAGAPSPPCASR